MLAAVGPDAAGLLADPLYAVAGALGLAREVFDDLRECMEASSGDDVAVAFLDAARAALLERPPRGAPPKMDVYLGRLGAFVDWGDYCGPWPPEQDVIRVQFEKAASAVWSDRVAPWPQRFDPRWLRMMAAATLLMLVTQGVFAVLWGAPRGWRPELCAAAACGQATIYWRSRLGGPDDPEDGWDRLAWARIAEAAKRACEVSLPF